MSQGKPAVIESPDGDIVISQGADCAFGYLWERGADENSLSPVQIEAQGWILTAQIRTSPGGTPWITLSSTADTAAGSGIAVNDSGEVVVYIDHVDTEAAEWNSVVRVQGGGVWDIEAFRPATVDEPHEKVRLVMGAVTLSPDVTREA